MGLISKEAPLPSANGGTHPGVATAEALEKAAKVTEGKPQPSAKDRSIALQVGFKVAGPAMVNYAGDPETWLALTKRMAVEIGEAILK